MDVQDAHNSTFSRIISCNQDNNKYLQASETNTKLRRDMNEKYINKHFLKRKYSKNYKFF